MSNLFVNFRTKILEFKKKHNLLVEKVKNVETEIPTETQIKNLAKEAITADKDVLNNITVEIENDKIIMPRYILPLFAMLDTDDVIFFNYNTGNVLDISGSSIGSISFDNYCVVLNDLYDTMGAENIRYLDYLLISENNDELLTLLNTYYLYFPLKAIEDVDSGTASLMLGLNSSGKVVTDNLPSSGTKLYKHRFYNATVGYSAEFIDNTSSAYQTASQFFAAMMDSPCGYGKINSGQVLFVNFGGPNTTFVYYNTTTELIEKVTSINDNLITDTVTPL